MAVRTSEGVLGPTLKRERSWLELSDASLCSRVQCALEVRERRKRGNARQATVVLRASSLREEGEREALEKEIPSIVQCIQTVPDCALSFAAMHSHSRR